jgi:prephenate dehydrogenase
VLAAPVLTNAALLPRAAAVAASDAVITDVGGAKRVMRDAARGAAGRAPFIGGHPMAGAAAGGLAAARPDLFEGRRWLLTPEPDVEATVVAQLSEWVRTLGAVPTVVDCDAHDRTLAYVSHLVQLASVSLMTAVADGAGAAGLTLAGPALRDAVRVAPSPSGPWLDVCAANADCIERALDDLLASLASLRASVRDARALDEAFARAQRAHAALERASAPGGAESRDL